ncbi:hypothetical protein BST61_g5983 [Cercospora zeina]
MWMLAGQLPSEGHARSLAIGPKSLEKSVLRIFSFLSRITVRETFADCSCINIVRMCTQSTTIRVDIDEQGRRRVRTEVVHRDCGSSSCPQSTNYRPPRS